MSESFAELFEESLKEVDMTPGAIVKGTIVSIDDDWVTVYAGLKSEGVIPREQFIQEITANNQIFKDKDQTYAGSASHRIAAPCVRCR